MATSAENDDRKEKDDADKGEADAAESKADDKDDAEDDADAAEDDAGEAKAVEERKAKRRKTGRTRPVQASESRSLGKSMILFVVIILGVAGGFWLLGSGGEPKGPAAPKWKTGETVDVEITLVPNDRVDLSCAATDEIAGKHCANESAAKPWSKGDAKDDTKLLKPYTTVEHVQFLAAGMWSQPALAADKLPNKRFSVKCKYKVDGTLKNVAVRWDPTGQWYPNQNWHAGSVSDCALVPPPAKP